MSEEQAPAPAPEAHAPETHAEALPEVEALPAHVVNLDIERAQLSVIYSGPEKSFQYGRAYVPVGKPFAMQAFDAATVVEAHPLLFAFVDTDNALATIAELAKEKREREEAALEHIAQAEAQAKQVQQAKVDSGSGQHISAAIRRALFGQE